MCGEIVERFFLEDAQRGDDADKVRNGLRNALIRDPISGEGIVELVGEGEHHIDNGQPVGGTGGGTDIFRKVEVEPVGDGFAEYRLHALGLTSTRR